MHPLHAILDWWESLADFPRDHIAADVCSRLIPHFTTEDTNGLFRGFLIEKLPANWYVGRALAIRAVVDFWFLCDAQSRDSEMLLEAVETASPSVRSLANDALGRMPQVHRDTDFARDKWLRLRESVVSDAALVSLERTAMIRRPLA